MMHNRLKYRKTRFLKTSPALSLTPLIDTALTLLVVFMVAAPVAHQAVRVELPKGVTGETTQPQQTRIEIVISVDHEKNFYVQGKKSARDMVMKEIETIVGTATPGNPVDIFLAIDQRVVWNDVYTLFDEIRQLPIEGLNVAFDITRPR